MLTTITAHADCGDKPADIVFVLDSSASEGAANFRKQIDFVSNLTFQLNVGNDKAQVTTMVMVVAAAAAMMMKMMMMMMSRVE